MAKFVIVIGQEYLRNALGRVRLFKTEGRAKKAAEGAEPLRGVLPLAVKELTSEELLKLKEASCDEE